RLLRAGDLEGVPPLGVAADLLGVVAGPAVGAGDRPDGAAAGLDRQHAAVPGRDVDTVMPVARLLGRAAAEGDRLDAVDLRPLGSARGRRGDDGPGHGATEPVADTHAASRWTGGKTSRPAGL